ncbi:MAG: NADPH-dependent F420 reductase [Dehalococcoidia bacterium]
MPQTIALVGGTGPEGRGLATRFVRAGHRVIIGSRARDRGESVAAELRDHLGGGGHLGSGELTGGSNEDAVADADIVVVTVPYEAHRPTLEGLRERLAGKIVVDAVVPVRFERGPRPVDVEAGSATEEAAAILPDSTVIGAFHNLPAEVLLEPEAPIDSDVFVTGGNAEAKAAVSALAEQIEGVRAVDAGPLRFSRFTEGITILLIGINGRYKAHAAIRATGLPER